jgi:hypothetical protein
MKRDEYGASPTGIIHQVSRETVTLCPYSSLAPTRAPPPAPRPPSPIPSEHAALRDRIECGVVELERQIPDAKHLDEAVYENSELANDVALLVELMREEREFLAGQGVDPRPWGW